MADEALKTSALLAKEYGPYPKYNPEAVEQSAYYSKNALGETKQLVKEYGLRNSQLLTIAPTGTLSTMLRVSGGIEPIFANYYTRKTESLKGHGLELPTRATKFSAGFDIRTPFSFTLKPGEVIKIPTGIKCRMNTDYVLMIYPRSGLGFKYQCNLVNGTGIIDCDFINSDNEGHIFIKLVNRGDKEFSVTSNAAIAQGIFLEYGITEDDHVEATRNGGFGSTDN